MRRLLVLLVLLGSLPAGANIFDIYGFNPRGISLGSAMVSEVDDYTATFYNPAALTRHKHITLGGGFTFSIPRLTVGRSVPVCLNGRAACNAAHGTRWTDRESALPGHFSGLTLGWDIPFGGLLQNKLAFGLALYLPTINIVRAEGLDPQTPQFYMYQNLPDEIVILASLAYRPWEWMSLGIGVQVLANVFGSAKFGLDPANGLISKQDFTVALVPKVAATAGLLFFPMPNLRIGLSYRQALSLEFGLPADFMIGDVVGLGLEVAGNVLYTPHQISIGLGYTFEKQHLTISAQADIALWSQAPDPSPHVSVDFKGKLLDAFGLQNAVDVSVNAPQLELKFRDIVIPRIGIEWGPLEWLMVRAGYFWRPSPVPYATGPSNYLDNDVHSVAFGAAFTFKDPLGVNQNPIRIEIGNSFGIMPRRTVKKQNADDPIGDLEHSGFTYALSVSVNYSY